ncbi:hypothetical protein [Tistlia consotensis]|nr:hypothetical protein [Tistlia consotensis]
MEQLFRKTSIFEVMEVHRREADKRVQGIEGDRLLNTPTDDLVAYMGKILGFEIPILKRGAAIADQHEQTRTIQDYGRIIEIPETVVTLTVPFTGDRDFFRVQPQTSRPLPKAVVNPNELVLLVKVGDQSADQIKAEFERQLDNIESNLESLRTTAKQFNDDLARLARNLIDSRKQKLLKDRQLVSGLGYRMKDRGDTSHTYAAPQVRRKIEPRLPPASAAPYKPEPVLDEAIYKEILGTIESMTMVMERSPSAFEEMSEEDLRQQYLVQLNGRFEGQATGETFNHAGKTDILIRVQDRNIFIAECKFWRGEKLFLAAVDQILSYLSWRDTKAAIVLFNRQKTFSAVLDKVRQAMEAHPQKKRGPSVEGETRFRYVLGNPRDPSREIILTVLAFDVPAAEAKS